MAARGFKPTRFERAQARRQDQIEQEIAQHQERRSITKAIKAPTLSGLSPVTNLLMASRVMKARSWAELSAACDEYESMCQLAAAQYTRRR